MIVGLYFEGDDVEVALKQHGVYDTALGIVVSTCNLHTNRARSLLNSSDHPKWGKIDRYDHRTLQFAHDLLAAVWRSRNDFRQASLLPGENRALDEVQPLWLDWLRNEIAGWSALPHLVRSVQLILTNQNEQPGYEAETQLCLDIVDRFPDVPWERRLRDALEGDLSRDREKPVIAPSCPRLPTPDNASCECVKRARPPCNQVPCRTMIEHSDRDGASRLE